MLCIMWCSLDLSFFLHWERVCKLLQGVPINYYFQFLCFMEKFRWRHVMVSLMLETFHVKSQMTYKSYLWLMKIMKLRSWNMIDHWYRLLLYYIFLSANVNDNSLILCLLWHRSRTAWIWSKKTAKLCKGKDPSNFRKRCARWHD